MARRVAVGAGGRVHGALWLTGTPFSVSSGVIGHILALFGVSVLTAVVYISYVNELRRGGMPLDADAIREGAILRLRPIMSRPRWSLHWDCCRRRFATGVGTDLQRPFALVIVAGLLTRLLISVFLMPALYALQWRAPTTGSKCDETPRVHSHCSRGHVRYGPKCRSWTIALLVAAQFGLLVHQSQHHLSPAVRGDDCNFCQFASAMATGPAAVLVVLPVLILLGTAAQAVYTAPRIANVALSFRSRAPPFSSRV